MMRHKLLWAILILGLLLRVVWIDKVPAGFTPDEASFGYDAYSILKTGKDQWGHSFPLVLESFGDFKPPLYSYILTPFVWLFGLEKWVVRFPNALFGTLAIYVTYLLVRELRKISNKKLEIGNWKLEILAAVLLTISPWHIMMSRGAFEANLTTFFLPLGIYLFLRGLKKEKYLVYSSVIFGLNLFSYHSAKLVTPIVIVILVLIYWSDIVRLGLKRLIKPAIVFGFFVCLMAYTFSQGAGARIMDVNIFNNSVQAAGHERTIAIQGGMNPTLARLFHNKYQYAVRNLSTSYFQYLSPKFFFTHGPGEATYGMMPGRGVLYWFELPLILGFFIYLVRNWKEKVSKILVAWILIAPIPASMAIGPGYSANRAVIMLPAIQIACAIGFLVLFNLVRKRSKRVFVKPIIFGYVIMSSFFFLAFLEDYYFRSPVKYAKTMLYGNLEASYWISGNIPAEDVYVSRKLSEPHIYIAFANKLNPKIFQKSTKSWKYSERGFGWVDQIPQYSLANFTFKNIHVEEYLDKSGAYLVGRPDEFTEDIKPLKTFNYPDGDPAIFIVKTESNIFAQK
jgi:4-amino-4-deoxy-L-arabinose transferase-like glycosyltransferase